MSFYLLFCFLLLFYRFYLFQKAFRISCLPPEISLFCFVLLAVKKISSGGRSVNVRAAQTMLQYCATNLKRKKFLKSLCAGHNIVNEVTI